MIINCLEIRDKKIEEIKSRISFVKENKSSKKYNKPVLVIITSGHDESSNVYINQKVKVGEKCGIDVFVHTMSNAKGECTTSDYIRAVNACNRRSSVSGIIVQLPLPAHIDEFAVLESINPAKDVDCMTSINVGRLHLQHQLYEPCTPKGIMSIFKHLNYDLTNKNVLILGRSNIVGRRLQELMTQADANVIMLHSRSQIAERAGAIIAADVIVCATGVKNLLDKEIFDRTRKMTSAFMKPKENYIIDVGINRNDDGSLCGDVDKELYNDDLLKCTTVPGGVGPMTVVSLMENVVQAYENKLNK